MSILIQIIFYIAITVVFFCLIYSIFYGLNREGFEKEQVNKFTALVAGSVFIWLALTAALSMYGYFGDYESRPPRILVAVVPPILAVMYIANSTRVNRLIDVIPKQWLVYAQSYRILTELVLWLLYINKSVPAYMTFAGRNFDIIIALSAPLVGYFGFKGSSNGKLSKLMLIVWNVAGILIALNFLIVSILSQPGPLRRYFLEPANVIFASYPYIWIPAFLLPFGALLHVLSIKQIMRFGQDKAI